jgi:hypothetical protein
MHSSTDTRVLPGPTLFAGAPQHPHVVRPGPAGSIAESRAHGAWGRHGRQ